MGLRLSSKSTEEQRLGAPNTKPELPALSPLEAVPGETPAHHPDKLSGEALPGSRHGLRDLQRHGLMVGCCGGPFGECISSVLECLGQGPNRGKGKDHGGLGEQVWANRGKRGLKGPVVCEQAAGQQLVQPCLPLTSTVCPISSLSTVSNSSPGRGSFSVHVDGDWVQQLEWDQRPEGPTCLGPAAGETKGCMRCACASAPLLPTPSWASQSAGQEVAMSPGWTQERPLALYVGYWRGQEAQASCWRDPPVHVCVCVWQGETRGWCEQLLDRLSVRHWLLEGSILYSCLHTCVGFFPLRGLSSQSARGQQDVCMCPSGTCTQHPPSLPWGPGSAAASPLLSKWIQQLPTVCACWKQREAPQIGGSIS